MHSQYLVKCPMNTFQLTQLPIVLYFYQIILCMMCTDLCDRSFRVVIGSGASFLVHLVCSVPQGSVLGLRMFIMYTADLAVLADEQRVNLHSMLMIHRFTCTARPVEYYYYYY